MRLIFDGLPIEYLPGDSIALAALRSGEHPAHGGTLCLSGDCGNCVATVDGESWVRTCQTPARPGVVVQRHPAVGQPTTTGPDSAVRVAVRHRSVDTAIVGGGASGRAAAAAASAAGAPATVFDAGDGNEVVGLFGGPTLIVRSAGVVEHVHAHSVVLATGAAELQPVCAGNQLRGLYTLKAAALMHAAGIPLGRALTVGRDLDWFEGETHVQAVHLKDGTRHECDAVVIALGRSPRDVLARMAPLEAITVVGPAAEAFELPEVPRDGVVCPCSKTTVDDLDGVWEKGFRDIELMKRASLCGTGTCQGSVCMPHLRAYVAARSGVAPAPFTARPAARQITMAEAAAGYHIDTFRRTPLHDEHVRLGASLDRFGGWYRPWNYGDPVAEYWAVREGVSLGDVSTLGKMIVSGPDVVEALERLYPNHVHDIKPGRSRYVLILNERGHILDDGMICRDSDTRFTLTFTSGGASTAEMWVRDWIETWGLNVHVLDRTVSHAAINVTGPLAGALLQRAGVKPDAIPKFLQHRHVDIAGVPCHVMRLSFTGEASFELHHTLDRSRELWQALMHEGRSLGIRPHGLEALFGLRLEKGHVIVGQDTEPDTSPRRIGMEWAVKMAKPAFVGRAALARHQSIVEQRKLFGFTMQGSAPVEGSVIRVNGDVVGHVSSSWNSPMFGHAVMLGWQKYLPHADTVEIDGRNATVSAIPFYDSEGARARM